MYRVGFILLAILAVVAGFLIGTLNAEQVTLDLLWWQLNWPLGLLIMLSLAVGLLLGVGLCWMFQVIPLKVRQRRRGQAAPEAAGKAPVPPGGA